MNKRKRNWKTDKSARAPQCDPDYITPEDLDVEQFVETACHFYLTLMNLATVILNKLLCPQPPSPPSTLARPELSTKCIQTYLDFKGITKHMDS